MNGQTTGNGVKPPKKKGLIKMSRRDDAFRYFNENKEYYENRVKYGIEIYRKGNAEIEVVGEDGKPVKGVKIIAKQKNHEFKYGANIFMLDEFESDEKNKIYREEFKNVFNLATVPFYWDAFEPEQGKPRFAKDSEKIYRRPASDLCVEYCLENGIEPKCHCLNYDNFIPSWLYDADVEYHKKCLEKRFAELAEHYKDVIPSWEVTNETYNERERYQTKFYKENDFVEWSFKTADKYFANNRLIINDYYVFENAFRENRSAYYMQIERLKRNGIDHLDTIGMQFHSFFPKKDEAAMAATRYNPIHLYEVFDKYAELGKKLQMTEITIPAYSNSPEDEEVQAELIEKVYSVFFSHPSMEAIIYWNVVDGYAAFAPQGDMTSGENVYYGGLMSFDMRKKPAFYKVQELFTKKWHTETETETGENGKAVFRGFYGDYDLVFVKDGKEIPYEISLSSKKNNVNKIILK